MTTKKEYRITTMQESGHWSFRLYGSLNWIQRIALRIAGVKSTVLILPLILLLSACSTLTPAQTSALTTTGVTLAAAIAGSSGPKTNADITAGLDAASVIYSAYKGQSIPASSIDTGITAVNNVLQAYTGNNPVTAGDIATISQLISAFTTTPTPAP